MPTKLSLPPIQEGTLTLTRDLLPGTCWSDLLTLYNGGQALVIHEAQQVTGPTSTTVTGKASFLNLPNLTVQAVFTDQATLRFTLIGPTPGPNPWRFSQAFPDLPLFTAAKRDDGMPFLDTLRLANAAFILTTADGAEPDGTPLVAGLNWVGDLFPQSLLGLLGTLMGVDQVVRLYGPIRLPKPGEGALPLALHTYPWEAGPVPGLDLQAELGIELTLPGTSLGMGQTRLRIWAPPSATWMEANETYWPEIAITGRMEIGSAGITADLVAEAGPNLQDLALTARFEGVTLENLAQLADLAGGADLFSSLPGELQAFGEALGGIALQAAGLQFERTLTPSVIWIEVGMPNLDATLIPGFGFAAPEVNFTVSYPFGGGARTIDLLVGATVGLGGTDWEADFSYPGGEAWLRMQDPTEIPVKAMLSEAGLPIPDEVPDLSIDGAVVSLGTDGSWSLNASLADLPPWTLDLGPTPLTLSSLEIALQQSPGRSSGFFSGEFDLGQEFSAAFAYELPGNFLIRADLPSGTISSLIESLTGERPGLPDGFDLSFEQTWIMIRKAGLAYTFEAATLINETAMLALTVQKAEKWGFATGFEISGDFTKLPGLSVLEPFLAFAGLQNVMLVISSLTDPGFTFPSSAAFNAPALGNQQVRLPAGVGGLVQGFNLYAKLSMAKGQGFQTLAKWLGIKLDGSIAVTLAVSVPDPSQNSKLFLSVTETIHPGITLTGQLGGLLTGKEVAAFLTGQVKAIVQGQPVRFDVTTLVVPNGILVSGSMLGRIKFDPLPLELGDLGLIIGMNWEGVPSLGVTATLLVERFQSSIALFFDSTDPARSLIAGSMDGLTLKDVAQLLANQQDLPEEVGSILGAIGLKPLDAFKGPATLATALKDRDLAAISSAFKAAGFNLPSSADGLLLTGGKDGVYHLTDRTTMTYYRLQSGAKGVEVDLLPQLYVAPQTTFIGGIQFGQGYHMEGALDFLLLKARMRVQITVTKGILADVTVDPITILDEGFFSVKAAVGDGGPVLSVASFEQPQQKDPMLRRPHALVNGRVRLLGQDLSATYLTVNPTGFAFVIGGQVNKLLQVDLQGKIDGLSTLSVNGGMVVGLDEVLDLGELGKLAVQTNVKGNLAVSYMGGVAAATVKGSFAFAGVHGEIPTLTLNVKGAALAQIGETLWVQVSSILQKALASSDQWLTWVGQKVITGAGQTAEAVGKVLSEAYHLTGDEIAAKTKQYLGYGVDGVTAALKGAGHAADEVVQILGTAGYGAKEISQSIGKLFKGASHVDTNFNHVDTPAGPHTDLKATHADVKRTHVDTKNHTDVKKKKVAGVTVSPHIDKKSHVDQTTTPHGDTKTPHSDQKVPPHGDTSSHVDIKV